MTHSLYMWDILMMLITHLDDPQPIQVRHTHDAEYTPRWPTAYTCETYSWCLLHTLMTHSLYRCDILMMLSTHLDDPQPIQVRHTHDAEYTPRWPTAYTGEILTMLITHLDDPQAIQVRHTHDAEYTPRWPTAYTGETYSWCLLHTSMTHSLYR